MRMGATRRRMGTVLGAAALACAAPSRAEVIRFEVLSTKPVSGGQLITARATIAVDPANPRDAVIADIARAPKNAAGKVEATSDVTILRPDHASGLLVVDLPNRGRPLGSTYLAAGSPTFLPDHSITVVEVAWQADVAEGLALHAPIIPGLTGRSRDTWVMSDTAPVTRLSLAWPVAADPAARVSIRRRPDAPAETPAGLSVRFIDRQTVEVTRPLDMATAGSVVELNYTATDPKVMGLGFAAVRDVAAFLKHAPGPQNPLADIAHRRAIGFGVSQSGRALRDLLYQGFNVDEAGRQVFEGMMPIIPGARRSFTNARFAQPGRNPGPIADRLYPVDQFPFAYEVSTDNVSGKRDGLLAPCRSTKSCPKIVEVDSEFEFWGSHASLNVTDAQGRALPIAPEARLFMVAGSQHGPDAAPRTLASCRLATSPVPHAPVARALLVDLDAWITQGAAPPKSRYPTLGEDELVVAERVYPTLIPALGYAGRYARAPQIAETPEGPVVKAWYPIRLPKADGIGNAAGGVRLPMVVAPRATYTGWNPQADFDGVEDLCTQLGGSLPLPATADAAAAAHDPRPSLATLYPTPEAYMASVRRAAEALQTERLLLPADAETVLRAAQATSVGGGPAAR